MKDDDDAAVASLAVLRSLDAAVISRRAVAGREGERLRRIEVLGAELTLLTLLTSVVALEWRGLPSLSKYSSAKVASSVAVALSDLSAS